MSPESQNPMNTGRPEISKPLSQEPLWTVEDTAAYLQLGTDTVRAMARRGELPALKIGRVWRFRKEDIDRFFQKLL